MRARYAAALEALLADPANDAVLVMNVPTALASADATPRKRSSRVAREQGEGASDKPVFAVWIGEDATRSETFEAAGIPHFADESHAVEGFMHLVRYREAQEALMATPPSLPVEFEPDVARARAIVQGALRGRQDLARSDRGHALLVGLRDSGRAGRARPRSRRSRVAAGATARGRQTVVVKILSPDIVHKSEVGGVRLNLTSAQAVREAAADILARARAAKPRSAHHRRDDPSDGAAAQGARADRRYRRRSDLRSGDRVRRAAERRSR